jgi:predicted DNA-binding protein (UPF0251 family)
MPRPKKCRRVGFIPKCLQFVPYSMEQELSGEVVVSIEEIEAIRLSDFEGLEQNDCAERMGVSRGTFQRIINVARQKIADALINGKSIRIEGGCYKREQCTLICKCCGHQWKDACSGTGEQSSEKCSYCNSEEVECMEQGNTCGKHCRRFSMEQYDIYDDGKDDKNE